jgi:hypothetical protein
MNTGINGAFPSVTHLIAVKAESDGRFTAQAVGLPDVCANSVLRETAIELVREQLRVLLLHGNLVAVSVPIEQHQPVARKAYDPDDPLQKRYLEDIARFRREDDEQFEREYEQQLGNTCRDSSLTPTT